MDKKKAIELLKQALNEIPHLKELHFDDQEFTLWCDKVRNIIKAALDSDDLGKFSVGSWKIPGMFPEDVYQQEYLEEHLPKYETALKSIIQNYELLGDDRKSFDAVKLPLRIFISHGKGEGALQKLESFLSELGAQTIVVKDQPNLDRTVDKKVEDCLSEADFVVILATGDDRVGDKLQPRQNVVHEIGLAQKTHPGRIIYLLEEGIEFPSNITPKVYERFARQSMDRAFTAIVRELRKLGFLIAIKP